MLKEVLREFSKGEMNSNSNIGRYLNISEGMVEQVLKDLGKMGYIEKEDSSCGSKCSSCSFGCGCSQTKNVVNMWRVTDKGKIYLEK